MRNRKWRFGILMLAIILLLPLPIFSALVWPPINLYIALIGIIICVLTCLKLPKIKWISAIITSLLIAIPPFPELLDFSNSGHVILKNKFNLFDYYNDTSDIVFLGGVFALNIFCFYLVFWALKKQA